MRAKQDGWMRKVVKCVLFEKNPLSVSRRKRMRGKLQNRTPSFLCPNCIGGLLFHELGLQFRSPTVNTMMEQRDFVKFVLRLEEYLGMELLFFEPQETPYPRAKLGDITIHFTHYQTKQEAAKKWAERSKRIDYGNLFVFLMESDGLTKEEIHSLRTVNARGLVVFTAREYEDIPYALHLKKYSAKGAVGNILKRVGIAGAREYERCFDFVKWFNEADGSYDISTYKR